MSSCRSCCVFDVPVVNDYASVLTIAPVQGFSIPVNCPPGYHCANQTINQNRIPSVVITPCSGRSCTIVIQGCQGPIRRTYPAGTSLAYLQNLAYQMMAEWAWQQAQCDTVVNQGVFNTLPRGTQTDVWNDEQCADALCPDGSVGAHKCVKAGAYGTTLAHPPFVEPPQSTVDQTKKQMNDLAKAEAQRQADAAKSCPSSNPCGGAFGAATYAVSYYDPIGAPYTSASGSGGGASFTMSAICTGLPAWGKSVTLDFSGSGSEIPYTPPVPGQAQICSLKLVVSTSGSFGGTMHLWAKNGSGVNTELIPVTGYTPGTTTYCFSIPGDTARLGFEIGATGCRYPNPPTDMNGATGSITINGTFGEGGSTCPACTTAFAGPTWNLTNWFGTPGDPPHSTGGHSASGPNFHIFASSDGVAMAEADYAVDFGYNGPVLPYDSKGIDLSCNLQLTTAKTGYITAAGGNVSLAATGPGGSTTILGLSGSLTTGNYPFTIPAGTTSLKFAATCYAANNSVCSIDISGSFVT